MMRDTLRLRFHRDAADRIRRPLLPRAMSRLSQLMPVVTILVLFTSGCGPRRPELHGVSGEVYFEGKPVTGAGVLFCPEGGRPAGAVTDDAGRFQLRTWRDADGTLAGTHVVCVTKSVPVATQTVREYPEAQNVLPPRYASPATSPLRANVSPGGTNQFRFDVER